MAGRRFGWSRAALLQLILGVNLMVMPPTPGPDSAFRYLGNEKWGRQGLASAREGTGLLVEGGAGLCWGLGSGRSGETTGLRVGGQGLQFL